MPVESVDVGAEFSLVVDTARALLALCQPLTGTRATGKLLVKAQAGRVVTIPRNRYLYPIVNDKARPDLLFKTGLAPDECGKEWVVDENGGEVDVLSNIGGARHNLPAGTKFAFDPPAPYAQPLPELAQATVGGVDATGFGSVKDAVVFESMEGDHALALRRSMTKGFPAIVLHWMAILPPEGSTSAHSGGMRRKGEWRYMYSLKYLLTVVSSRADEDSHRRHEGLVIVDRLLGLLPGRYAVDGQNVSSPMPVSILNAQREALAGEDYQRFYAYNMLISCEGAVVSEPEGRSYADWLMTSLTSTKPP